MINDFFAHAFEFVFLAFLLNMLISLFFGVDLANMLFQFIQGLIAKMRTPKDKDSD